MSQTSRSRIQISPHLTLTDKTMVEDLFKQIRHCSVLFMFCSVFIMNNNEPTIQAIDYLQRPARKDPPPLVTVAMSDKRRHSHTHTHTHTPCSHTAV